jgi:hypothetical protein
VTIDWPAWTSVTPSACSTRTVPRSTTVYSVNSGVWAGSSHPGGATMWAMDSVSSPLLTRPTYSSMTLPPGTGMRVAPSIFLTIGSVCHVDDEPFG